MSERRRIIEPVAPAIGLLIGAVFLMVCSLASDQWLESSEPHFEVGDDYVRSIGLFGNVKLDDLGMRWVGMVLMIAVLALLGIGMFKRWALHAVQLCTFLAIGAHAWWIFSQRDAVTGRGFVLGVVSLALIVTGTTSVLMRSREVPASQQREVGETVDGLKHGRWHVYDDNGKCIAIEEWDKGTLVKSTPYERP